MAKSRDQFSDWLGLVPGAGPRLGGVGDERETFERWLASVPGPAARLLRDPAAAVDDDGEDEPYPDVVPRYGLCEAEDGHMPVLRMFSSPEALAHRLAELEGRDVVAWAFHGSPLSFTRGPVRYLELPDGSAVRVPSVGGLGLERLEALPDGVEPQDDGFLGPPELILGTAGYWDGPAPSPESEPSDEGGWADGPGDDQED